MMTDVIDEVAWELKRISRNIKETKCVPNFLAIDLQEQAMKLQELYNELCYLEKRKTEEDE